MTITDHALSKEKNFISAVVYINNFSDHTANNIDSLNTLLNNNFETYEIICVVDTSCENALCAAKNLKFEKKCKMYTVLNMGLHQGLENGMCAGIDVSIGDFVLEFDYIDSLSDFSYVMSAYKECLSGSDIVNVTSKKPASFSSKVFYSIFNKFSYNKSKIGSEIFRIVSRRAINRVGQQSKTITLRKLAYLNSGLKCKEIITTMNIKKGSTTGQRDSRKKLAAATLFLYSNFAYKLASFLSFFMLLLSIGMGAYALVSYLFNTTIEGWTTTILFLSIGFAAVFMLFAITIKYISLLLEVSISKKNYKVESIEKINGISQNDN